MQNCDIALPETWPNIQTKTSGGSTAGNPDMRAVRICRGLVLLGVLQRRPRRAARPCEDGRPAAVGRPQLADHAGVHLNGLHARTPDQVSAVCCTSAPHAVLPAGFSTQVSVALYHSRIADCAAWFAGQGRQPRHHLGAEGGEGPAERVLRPHHRRHHAARHAGHDGHGAGRRPLGLHRHALHAAAPQGGSSYFRLSCLCYSVSACRRTMSHSRTTLLQSSLRSCCQDIPPGD